MFELSLKNGVYTPRAIKRKENLSGFFFLNDAVSNSLDCLLRQVVEPERYRVALIYKQSSRELKTQKKKLSFQTKQ